MQCFSNCSLLAPLGRKKGDREATDFVGGQLNSQKFKAYHQEL